MSTAHVKVERICPENATETTTGSNVSSPPPGRSTLVQDMKNRLEDLDDGTSQASRPSYCSVKVRLHNLYTPGSRAYRQWNGGVPYIEYRAGGTRTKVFVGSVVTTLVSGPATIEPDEPSSVTPSVPCGTCHGYSWVASGWNAPGHGTFRLVLVLRLLNPVQFLLLTKEVAGVETFQSLQPVNSLPLLVRIMKQAKIGLVHLENVLAVKTAGIFVTRARCHQVPKPEVRIVFKEMLPLAA